MNVFEGVNTNQWPINNRQNLVILCTKQIMVVRQALFSSPTYQKKKVVWPHETFPILHSSILACGWAVHFPFFFMC